MNAVIDTSVAVAWYLDERFSLPARDWQERALSGGIRVMVPSLHYLEFANVLRTHVRRGGLDAKMAADIYELHLDAPLDVVDPARADILRTAMTFDCTAYDAAFIALATSYDALLVTAERTTTPWVVKLGKRVVAIG